MAHAAFTIFGIKYKIARLQIVRCNFNAESVIGSKVCGCIFIDGMGVIYNVGSRVDTCRVQTLVDQTGAIYIGSRCSGTANFLFCAGRCIFGTYRTPIKVFNGATREYRINAMLQTAAEYASAGTKYKVGCSGTPGTYVDCSGLIYQCLYAAGINPASNIVDHALAKNHRCIRFRHK